MFVVDEAVEEDGWGNGEWHEGVLGALDSSLDSTDPWEALLFPLPAMMLLLEIVVYVGTGDKPVIEITLQDEHVLF